MLWLLFFLVLGLRRDDLTRFAGWAVTLLSLPTCALPAFLALAGNCRTSGLIATGWAVGLAALLIVAKLLPVPSYRQTSAAGATDLRLTSHNSLCPC